MDALHKTNMDMRRSQHRHSPNETADEQIETQIRYYHPHQFSRHPTNASGISRNRSRHRNSRSVRQPMMNLIVPPLNHHDLLTINQRNNIQLAIDPQYSSPVEVDFHLSHENGQEPEFQSDDTMRYDNERFRLPSIQSRWLHNTNDSIGNTISNANTQARSIQFGDLFRVCSPWDDSFQSVNDFVSNDREPTPSVREVFPSFSGLQPSRRQRLNFFTPSQISSLSFGQEGTQPSCPTLPHLSLESHVVRRNHRLRNFYNRDPSSSSFIQPPSSSSSLFPLWQHSPLRENLRLGSSPSSWISSQNSLHTGSIPIASPFHSRSLRSIVLPQDQPRGMALSELRRVSMIRSFEGLSPSESMFNISSIQQI